MIIMSFLVIVSTSINQYVKTKRFDAIKSFQQIFNASLEQFSGAVDISNGISTSVSLQRRLNVVGKMLFSSMITCQQRKIYEPCLNLEVCPQLVSNTFFLELDSVVFDLYIIETVDLIWVPKQGSRSNQ